MSCAPFRERITAWVDGELGKDAEVTALEIHLAGCEACRIYAEAEAATKSLVVAGYRGPVDIGALRERLFPRLGGPARLRRPRIRLESAPLRVPRLAWSALAAALVAALALGALMLRPEAPVEASPIVRAAVNEHVVCMMGRVPLEVTTTDEEEVGRWVRGRLARGVTLPALVPDGEAQISARVAHLATADAVQIFFDRRGQMLSLFILPTSEAPRRLGQRVTRATRDFFVSEFEGHTVVFWHGDELLYSLVAEEGPDDALALAAEYSLKGDPEGRSPMPGLQP